MPRPKIKPIVKAVENVLSGIMLGGKQIPIGLGEAPECPPPYLIISSGTQGGYTGPWTDPDADASDRIQITAVGISDETSLGALDKAREQLTFANLVAEGIPDRKILSVNLNLSRGGFVEQRGIPEPLFSNVDQYLIATTPG